MKKILHVIDSLQVGGAEKLLVGIINDLTEFENHLLILRGPTPLKGEIRNLSSFCNLQTTSFKNVLTKLLPVNSYIRKQKFDIVHSHLYESNILSRFATPRRTKLINSIHAVSSLASYKQNKASLYLERLTYSKGQHLIHVSQTVSDDFHKHVGIKGPSMVLYNFIEDVFFNNQPKNDFNLNNLKLVAVGNLRNQKNYLYLIDAFKHMPSNVTLDIYGEGNMRQQLQTNIDKYQLKINMLGLKNNLYEILPHYDLFVMSSFFEGQPVALLEAMASGLPALLSDIPVLKEVGQNAALYFDLANPLDFVKRIEEVSNGQHNLANLSGKGYEFASENAKKEVYMAKLRRLYTS